MPQHPPPRAERDAFAISLVGDVDIARRSELDELVSAFRASGSADVDVDLSGVEFLDSTGLGAVFQLRRITEDRGGTVRLRSPNSSVRRVLEVSGACDICEIVD